MPDPLEKFVTQISAARQGYHLPSRASERAEQFARDTLRLLFPHFADARRFSPLDVRAELDQVGSELAGFLEGLGRRREEARELSDRFLAELPGVAALLALDAEATFLADPAARTRDEVILAYPGVYAIACYRIAHVLCRLGVGLLPRLITESAHRATGIDINPGAIIGRSLAIDHGTGIVIGETTVIGDRVRLYQGVTLGALSVRKEFARQKRHPTIEDDVVIYANATILGGDTVIGAGSVIGGNVWLTHSVPPGSVVTHRAAVERAREAEEPLLEFNI
jgi:serine O-acetyltransferase